MLSAHPVATIAAPPGASTSSSRYYYEVYVGQDPSWNLVNSGWVASDSQGYGAGEMAAAQFNLAAQTRVYDTQSSTWSGWTTAQPAGGTPDYAGNPTIPTPSPSDTSTTSGTDVATAVVKVGLAIGIVALLAYALKQGAKA